jgi:hypothetical protein
MDALGRVFDIGLAWVPVDLDGADGATGTRLFVGDCSGVTFVLASGTGPATVSLDVTQHTASVSGTTADLDKITYYYHKSEATLDNDEAWVKVTQSVASEVTLDAIGTLQKLVAVEIDVASLTDGYAWISVNAVSANGTAHLATGIYIKHGLRVQRAPENMPNLLNPGAADA